MPGCNNCSQSFSSSTGYLPVSCSTANSGCYMDAGCVIYSGPPLTCASIDTGDPLDTILQKIDPLLCAATGDYSTYNTFCLAPITSQVQFVESISQFVCNLQTAVNNFIGVTFVSYTSGVQSQLSSISSPNITCSSAGVISTDDLNTVLTKYCSKFSDIDAALNPSAANWNTCYSVSPAPTTVVQGFNVLLSQICLLKSQVNAGGGGALPVFNNTGSCLPSPGPNDTLVDTVNKIKTRLCQTGTINNAAITWGCVAQPSGAQDLQTTIQNIITVLTATTKATPTAFSADFVVANVDPINPCLGKIVSLATPSAQDRFVAVTASDLTPGTLQDKLLSGTNMTFDYVTTPGKVILNSTGGGGGGGGLVLADSTDVTADYLINKLNGGLSQLGITITPSLDSSNPTNHEVSLQLTIDPVALFTSLLNALSTDSGLKNAFCAAVSSCPSPCSAPMNVQVTYTSGTTSTSTTTTTTL